MSDEKFRFGLDPNKGHGEGGKKVPTLPADLFPVSQMLPKVASEKKKEARSGQRKVNPNDTRNLEASDLKNLDWENISPAKRFSDKNKEMDLRSVAPSRANVDAENNYGGTGILPGVGNTMQDPNVIKSKSNSELTNTVISDAKARREAHEERHKRPEEARDEWEIAQKAKTTADVPAGQMGFTPHKTSYAQQPMPEVKVPAIEAIKSSNKKSADAGVEAAGIKAQLDNVMMSSMDSKMKGEYSWEAEAQEKINTNLNKPIEAKSLDIEISKPEMRTPKPAKTALDVSNVFSMPQDPATAEEKSIKRSSKYLSGKRTHRSEDRSWEKVQGSKKLGKF